MTSETIDAFRGATYEVAEAIAPTWERRRAEIEEVSTPVREWMLHALRPYEGDTVLELGAGVGERTTELLRGGGFVAVHTEEVPVRFRVPDVDEYMGVVADTAGPLGLALRGLSDADRADVKGEVEHSFGRFAAGDGYELPGVALCAVASESKDPRGVRERGDRDADR